MNFQVLTTYPDPENNAKVIFVAIKEGNSEFTTDFENKIGYLELNVTGSEIDIVDLFTEPNFRRKGIAETLLETMFKTYKECEIFLEVRVSNVPAISLYRKMGFETVNIRKKYYSDPVEDALLMTLKI
jgi:ribosomal-protein-alanine N-acetyltransferase